jgi:hypothetical protein
MAGLLLLVLPAWGCTELNPLADAGDAAPPQDARIAESDAGPDASDGASDSSAGDAAIDSSAGDGSAGDGGAPDSALHPCELHAAKLADFVEAHRSCVRDDDCVIVGDCNHADFPSVSRAFEAEATALVLDDAQCGAHDGPTYNAVCRAGVCDRIRSHQSCGQVPPTECPGELETYRPGCGTVASAFRAGCQASCTDSYDSADCAPGYNCQQTSIDPCGPVGCAACGQEVWLCLPAPSCQVQLSVSFDGVSLARIADGQSTELQLWLENRTDQTLNLSFDMPCHGPAVEGLGSFDVWQACVAGACVSDPVQTELTLAPRQKLLWKSAVLTSGATVCNPAGLASGTYTATFSLPGVTGATTCGPSATSLLVDVEAL